MIPNLKQLHKIAPYTVALDVETGGQDSTRHPTLAIAAFMFGPDGEFFRSRELVLQPGWGCLDPEALKYNGWTPEIGAQGVTAAEAWEDMETFFQGLPERPVLVAHNPFLDISFLDKLAERYWRFRHRVEARRFSNELVNKRVIDSQSIGRVLQLQGKVPDTSLRTLLAYCGLPDDAAGIRGTGFKAPRYGALGTIQVVDHILGEFRAP